MNEVVALGITWIGLEPLEEGHADGNRTMEENNCEYTKDLRDDRFHGRLLVSHYLVTTYSPAHPLLG
jgi:hypothetical protein